VAPSSSDNFSISSSGALPVEPGAEQNRAGAGPLSVVLALKPALAAATAATNGVGAAPLTLAAPKLALAVDTAVTTPSWLHRPAEAPSRTA